MKTKTTVTATDNVIDLDTLARVSGGVTIPQLPFPFPRPNPFPFPRPFPNPLPNPLPNPFPRPIPLLSAPSFRNTAWIATPRPTLMGSS